MAPACFAYGWQRVKEAWLGLGVAMSLLATAFTVELSVFHLSVLLVVTGNVAMPLGVSLIGFYFRRQIWKLGKLLTEPNSAGRLKRLSASGLTNLAVLLAGRERPALRGEWRAHLAGESGDDPATLRKIGQALGFIAAAIRLRLADIADLAWRPVDAVLGSRTLSNLFVWGPVIVTLFAIIRHDGRFGLVADDQDPVALGAFLYGTIRTGRWWRGIKPPSPKARHAQETDPGTEHGGPSPEA